MTDLTATGHTGLVGPGTTVAAEFRVAGQRLVYELIGDGETVLFLANIAVPASEMRAFAPILNAAGYQLMLVDYLGPAEASIEEIAAHVGELIDTLDIHPWVWGYSQGAYIAQELGLLRPDRVRGAILAATRGRTTRFLEQYVMASGDVDGADVSDHVAAVFYLLAMMSPDLLCDDDQMELMSHGVLRVRKILDEERSRRSVRASAGYGNRLEALAGVRVPCLVLSFENDLVCPPQLGREVADAIPEGEYLEISGAGHGGMTTHATDVVAAVTEFLGRWRNQPGRQHQLSEPRTSGAAACIGRR
ncbi:MAG TPA: alpha/beta hydrolase [Actinomycetales bacterium]|nr:alpha/beta hydrolase [Actinomycetales bacterium]